MAQHNPDVLLHVTIRALVFVIWYMLFKTDKSIYHVMTLSLLRQVELHLHVITASPLIIFH